MNINELVHLQKILSDFNSKHLKIQDIKSLIKIKSKLSDDLDEVREVRQEILNSYDVGEDFSTHKDAKEIKEKIIELNDTVFNLVELANTIDEEPVIKAAQDKELNLQDVELLYKYIIKK